MVKNEIPVATPSAPENNPPKTPDAVKKPQKPIEPIKKDPKTDEVLDEFDALLDAIVAE